VNERFSPGDWVSGFLGWQTHALVKAGTPLNKIDVSRVPKSAYFGFLGMTGVTAWMGLTQIESPKPGQTVVVSAASGAVGSIAGQIAKLMGAGPWSPVAQAESPLDSPTTCSTLTHGAYGQSAILRTCS
jgi:NADPH-dependent curcumin reductase CurA